MPRPPQLLKLHTAPGNRAGISSVQPPVVSARQNPPGFVRLAPRPPIPQAVDTAPTKAAAAPGKYSVGKGSGAQPLPTPSYVPVKLSGGADL